jgi:hypothetical protein
VKNDRIGRSVIMSADDLKGKAIGALRRLQKLPGIVRGFLRDPKLAYILELHPGTAHGVYKGISSLVSIDMRTEPVLTSAYVSSHQRQSPDRSLARIVGSY